MAVLTSSGWTFGIILVLSLAKHGYSWGTSYALVPDSAITAYRHGFRARQQTQPSMFLDHQLAPISLSPTSSSPIRSKGRLDTIQQCDEPKQSKNYGVLGFSTSLFGTVNSNVDLDAWRQADASAEGRFSSPALAMTWNSKPVQVSSIDPIECMLECSLPAWFPWIPTKAQIDSLKLTELKVACSQRRLRKSGNKTVLKRRLLEWTIHQQQLHQDKITGDYLTRYFEEESVTNFAHSDTDVSLSSKMIEKETQLPNSLAEWARTIDLEPLLQKRKEIHRRKREGRSFPKKSLKREQPAMRDYLLSLTRALHAPSFPFASNIQVKELYAASKKADQIGERKVAIDLLHILMKVTPNDARVHRRLARMQLEQGEVESARRTLQIGVRKLPSNPWLWHGIGQLELKHGSLNLARENFEKAISCDPSFAHSFHALGTLEHTQGNIAKAMRLLKKGIEFSPANHRLWHAAGDVYRSAQMLDDAARSYQRAIESGPSTGHCFAYSALAAVAYEQGKTEKARKLLLKSIDVSNGRHAQGWLALSQLEEVMGSLEKAELTCINAVAYYEHQLLKDRKYHSNKGWKAIDELRGGKPAVDIKKSLMSAVPRFRSGDKFFKIYQNWARIARTHGSFEKVDQVYERALAAFPLRYELMLEWAEYYVDMLNHERAREIYMDACKNVKSRHASPFYRLAEMEMSLSNFHRARKILFNGARMLTHSGNGGLGNDRGLPELFHTWAICEWHLGNLDRAEVLFDRALRCIDRGEEENKMRGFILYSLARLEYHRGELYLAQHCIGLALKENLVPCKDGKMWDLWAEIAEEMGNVELSEECRGHAVSLCGFGGLEASDSSSSVRRPILSSDIATLTRVEPWQYKLFGIPTQPIDRFFRRCRYPRMNRMVA